MQGVPLPQLHRVYSVCVVGEVILGYNKVGKIGTLLRYTYQNFVLAFIKVRQMVPHATAVWLSQGTAHGAMCP